MGHVFATSPSQSLQSPALAKMQRGASCNSTSTSLQREREYPVKMSASAQRREGKPILSASDAWFSSGFVPREGRRNTRFVGLQKHRSENVSLLTYSLSLSSIVADCNGRPDGPLLLRESSFSTTASSASHDHSLPPLSVVGAPQPPTALTVSQGCSNDEEELRFLTSPSCTLSSASSTDSCSPRTVSGTSTARSESTCYTTRPSSILKIKTQDLSLEKVYTAKLEEVSSTNACYHGVKDVEMPRRCNENRTVKFDSVSIYSHELVLGDNPSTTEGPPISIDWEHFDVQVVALQTYEQNRPVRREKREMLLPDYYREDLLRDAGYSRQELQSTMSAMAKIRHDRYRSSRDGHFGGKLVRRFLSKESNLGHLFSKSEQKRQQQDRCKDPPPFANRAQRKSSRRP